MKRVCHILHGWYMTDSRVKLEAESLVDAGCSVDVICIGEKGQPARSVVNGVNVYRLPLARERGSMIRYLYEYAAFFVLTSLVLAFRIGKRYCAIHANNMPDFLVFTALLPKLFGCKVVLDVHDMMPELFQSKYGLSEHSIVVRMLRWQLKWSVRFSDAVITTSYEMRRVLQSIVPGKDVTLLMNMPNAGFVEAALRPPADRAQVKPEFRMLYTGTVSERYGLQTVIEALPELRQRIPGISLSIVGSGDQVPELQELAGNLGVSDCVEFRGYVPWMSIPELIRESDVGVSALLNDIHNDLCFVGKVIEYATAGLPTIVSRTRAMEYYYNDGVVKFFRGGDVKSFQEAVIELYESPELRETMSRRGVEFGGQWNWNVERAKYVGLIGSLCGGVATPAGDGVGQDN